MSVFAVQTSTRLPRYVQRVTLDGGVYSLDFHWNTRLGAWFVDVLDADGEVLVAGRRCVVDNILLGQFEHLEIPPGILTVFDTSRRLAPPVLDDFGTRVLMLYFDKESADSVIRGVS